MTIDCSNNQEIQISHKIHISHLYNSQGLLVILIPLIHWELEERGHRETWLVLTAEFLIQMEWLEGEDLDHLAKVDKMEED